MHKYSTMIGIPTHFLCYEHAICIQLEFEFPARCWATVRSIAIPPNCIVLFYKPHRIELGTISLISYIISGTANLLCNQLGSLNAAILLHYANSFLWVLQVIQIYAHHTVQVLETVQQAVWISWVIPSLGFCIETSLFWYKCDTSEKQRDLIIKKIIQWYWYW